ncbi:hypothetical protein [Enterococcus rotai]|uniref:hypothetical protein n=1 Tax=Enterococcus rotai TaxID=118060 RepID=UPI0032B39CEF
MAHKRWVRIFCLLLLGMIVFAGIPKQAQAQELPKGMVIGDEQGIVAKKNGEYLMEVKDVMPGKNWHTTISMVNMEKGIPYKLTMLISPSKVSGDLDLSKSIQMTLTYQNKQIYQGPISGVSRDLDLQRTPLDLGVFQAGDSRALEVDFSLSGKYTKEDFAVKNLMENVWTFYAVATTNTLTPKMHGIFPATGEAIKQGMIFLCLGLFIVLIILLIWKSKRKKNK